MTQRLLAALVALPLSACCGSDYLHDADSPLASSSATDAVAPTSSPSDS